MGEVDHRNPAVICRHLFHKGSSHLCPLQNTWAIAGTAWALRLEQLDLPARLPSRPTPVKVLHLTAVHRTFLVFHSSASQIYHFLPLLCIASWRHNFRTTHFTRLKPVQWLLAYPQSCTSITTINFRTFPHCQKKSHTPWPCQLLMPLSPRKP